MTLPSTEKEGQQEKQGKQEDETSLRAKNEDIVDNEDKSRATEESELVDGAVCIQLFCIEEKYEMRFDIFVICISLYYPKDQRII